LERDYFDAIDYITDISPFCFALLRFHSCGSAAAIDRLPPLTPFSMPPYFDAAFRH